MTTRPPLPAHIRAVIDAAAERKAAEAPPLKDWQIASLIQKTRPRRRRNAA